MLYQLICMVCGREGPGVEFKVCLMQSNNVNAHTSDATIIISFDSQADVIQVKKYCTKWETSSMTVYMHYLCQALLFQCIFSSKYSCLSLPLTIHGLIVSKQPQIKSLN